MVKILTIYGEEKTKKTLKCGKTLTQQNFKDECDVNRIMERYQVTGYLVDPLRIRTAVPKYGEFTNVPDFQTAQNIIVEGREAFEKLPSGVRKYFANDPALYLSFITDSDNFDEAIKMGLLDPNYVPRVEEFSPDPVPDPVLDPIKE